ncbi:MAG: lipid-A-disaccharide synthase [Verrucomicrobia bacterium]|nr:lipid-A-disaccharide synthase [Verrucomicrobiota bacterium]
MKIFLFAGETSGDLHGHKLVRELKVRYPEAKLFGVGGPRMRAEGLDCTLPMENFQVMGFIDVLFALPKLMRHFFFLRNMLLKEEPDIALFIDYPGFSLALAKSLRRRSFKGKICHYICPSVWAWGKKRIGKMEKILDHLFTIFPFEPPLFDPKKLHVDYVGHPLVQNVYKGSALGMDQQNRLIALFPGSRQKEIERNFPIQLQVAKRLLETHPDLHFIVSVSEAKFSPLLEKMMVKEGLSLQLLDSAQNGALMKSATLAIAKSGTNNLELALHQVPTVVIYGVGSVDLFIVRYLLRIILPFYCIVNIVGGKEVYPELIGPNLTVENLYQQAASLLSSPEAREECRGKCGEIGKILGNKVPEAEIARILKNLIDEKRSVQNLH